MPLGINVEHFRNPDGPAKAALRARWGLPSDKPVAVFVGRLRYYKGLEYLLRALPLVPDVHLLLVGDGPLWDRTRALTASLGVSNRVVFTGDVGEVELPGCYIAGDLFVLPSHTRAEAFGTSIVEAMAAGLPVISTEIQTGTSWVNQHGSTGLVVPACDPDALAGAMRTLVANPSLRLAMGQAGLARARRRVPCLDDGGEGGAGVPGRAAGRGNRQTGDRVQGSQPANRRDSRLPLLHSRVQRHDPERQRCRLGLAKAAAVERGAASRPAE